MSHRRELGPEQPIDETVLDQLGSLRRGSPDFALKIVTLYLDTSPSILKELESAALAEDMAWLRTVTHRLNSASLAIGAVRVAARCNELDRMLRTGPIADAIEWARIIVEEYNRAEAALRRWCVNRQAH